MKKKIILILIILFAKTMHVMAEEFEWTSSLEEGITAYETEMRYKWYKEEVEGEFLEYGKISEKYKIKSNIPYYEEYTDWSLECDNVYDAEYKILNGYQEILPVRYVEISKFNKLVTLKQLTTYYKNEPINSQYFYKKPAVEGSNIFDQDSKYIIDLKKEYDIKDIKILVRFLESDISKFKITLYNDRELTKINASNYVYSSEEFHKPNKDWLEESSWTNMEYTTEEITPSDFNKIYNNITFCRYRPKYYYWFNVKRKYYDDNYYNYVDGYIKDEDNYKLYYKYKKNNYNKINNYEYKYIYLDRLIPFDRVSYIDKKIIVPGKKQEELNCKCRSVVEVLNNSNKNDLIKKSKKPAIISILIILVLFYLIAKIVDRKK